MQIISSSKEMQTAALQLRAQGKRLALVPTMGFLHEGHLKLVDAARQHADHVAMSIFVNPTQFGPLEDFHKYPRDLNRDKQMAQSRGVDFLFTPPLEEIYPAGDQTQVLVTELTRGLDGAFRPGHFRGVTTVVAKLLSISQACVALFGEKDYQQLMAIRRMVRDLHLPIEIIGVPTVREEGGLAMSSRNTYLTGEERSEAWNIYQSILRAQEALREGERDVACLTAIVKSQLAQGAHLIPDYTEIVDAETLLPLQIIEREARLVLAVHLNGKRLIDNGPLIP